MLYHRKRFDILFCITCWTQINIFATLNIKLGNNMIEQKEKNLHGSER